MYIADALEISSNLDSRQPNTHKSSEFLIYGCLLCRCYWGLLIQTTDRDLLQDWQICNLPAIYLKESEGLQHWDQKIQKYNKVLIFLLRKKRKDSDDEYNVKNQKKDRNVTSNLIHHLIKFLTLTRGQEDQIKRII